MHRSPLAASNHRVWLAAMVLPTALAFPNATVAQQAATATQPTLTFTNVQEALRVGEAYVRSKNFVQGREALEQALKLNPDARQRYRIHEALVGVYQTLDDPEPMVTTIDFLLRNAEGPANLLTARRQILSYAVAKKKGAEIAPRYEKALLSQPADRTALIILSGLYAEALKQPKRGGELTDTLMGELRKLYNDKVPTGVLSDFATQYGKCDRHREAAGLWEQLVAVDNHLRPWYTKELAVTWLAAGDKEKALTAARAATAGETDKRNPLLTHFWHRHLGEVFLATGDFTQAVTQLERAIAVSPVEGYKVECRKKLEEARKGLGT